MRPAPQGRGYRVRKRSNHVTLVVDSKNGSAVVAEPVHEEPKVAEEVAEVKAETKAKKTPAKKTTRKKTK
jgi:large subunit ribosomal protein L22